MLNNEVMLSRKIKNYSKMWSASGTIQDFVLDGMNQTLKIIRDTGDYEDAFEITEQIHLVVVDEPLKLVGHTSILVF